MSPVSLRTRGIIPLAGPARETADVLAAMRYQECKRPRYGGVCIWRRRTDSNRRCTFLRACSLSRGVPSTSRPRLQNEIFSLPPPTDGLLGFASSLRHAPGPPSAAPPMSFGRYAASSNRRCTFLRAISLLGSACYLSATSPKHLRGNLPARSASLVGARRPSNVRPAPAPGRMPCAGRAPPVPCTCPRPRRRS